MTGAKSKLELTWVGKGNRPRLEPRILEEVPEHCYGDQAAGNVLIHGDNLLALKALEQEFAGKVKCIFIDPPYNTGSAFPHYDDGLEHSLWLTMMRNRIEVLHRLLSDDGSIWITIDDNEAQYLKVLCDEIIGRANFVSSIAWVKRVSPANDAKYFSSDHDSILVYARTKAAWRPNHLARTNLQNAFYKNPDNDTRGPWNSVTYTGNKTREERPNLYYPITNPFTGESVWPPQTLTWRYGPETHRDNEANGLLYWGKDGRSRAPRLKMFLNRAEKVVPRSVWPAAEVGSTQSAMIHQKSLFREPFATPKPEELLARVLEIGTIPSDLVLDSFGGSGTTGAVAQKMGRRWIMVELGNHVYTHIIPRMKKVIDGQDPGGITEAVGWQGGGGFKFYRLAESLLVKDKELSTSRRPFWVINAKYDSKMLIQAICKIENFRFSPDSRWDGMSSEHHFLHVTTKLVTQKYLDALADQLAPEEALLVYSTRRVSNLKVPDQIELKKIPKDLLGKCEFEEDKR